MAFLGSGLLLVEVGLAKSGEGTGFRSLTFEQFCWAVYALALSYQSGPLLFYCFVLFSIVFTF